MHLKIHFNKKVGNKNLKLTLFLGTNFQDIVQDLQNLAEISRQFKKERFFSSCKKKNKWGWISFSGFYNSIRPIFAKNTLFRVPRSYFFTKEFVLWPYWEFLNAFWVELSGNSEVYFKEINSAENTSFYNNAHFYFSLAANS